MKKKEELSSEAENAEATAKAGPLDIKYRLTLQEMMLGSKPSNAGVFTDYIASRKQDGLDGEELKAAEEAEDRVKESMTIFHRMEDGETPMIWDYQIKGMFKDACGSLRRVPGSLSSSVKAYKSVIDAVIFVKPRKIPLILPEGAKVGVFERPLRAETMQGPRVALAKSETVPAGTTLEFTVKLLVPSLKKLVEEWLEYGALRGLGQFRNGGFGVYTWEEIKD